MCCRTALFKQFFYEKLEIIKIFTNRILDLYNVHVLVLNLPHSHLDLFELTIIAFLYTKSHSCYYNTSKYFDINKYPYVEHCISTHEMLDTLENIFKCSNNELSIMDCVRKILKMVDDLNLIGFVIHNDEIVCVCVCEIIQQSSVCSKH